MPSVKKATTTRALTVWEQKMVEAAEKSAKSERAVSGLQGISIRGATMTVDEQPVPGNELQVVVLVAMHENQWYEGVYNPNVPSIPSCYAFGEIDAEDPEGAMKPHEAAENPQGDDNGLCANCWANAMGSAEQTRGKACKNVRRLALITADNIESAESIRDAEVRVLKLPVTSVKGWALYVRNTLKEELKRPYWGVVTRIKVVPDPKTQLKVLFTMEQLIDFDEETFAALEKKTATVKPQLGTPYIKPEAPQQVMRPQGRAAQAMQKGRPAAPAKKGAQAAPAKKAKY